MHPPSTDACDVTRQAERALEAYWALSDTGPVWDLQDGFAAAALAEGLGARFAAASILSYAHYDHDAMWAPSSVDRDPWEYRYALVAPGVCPYCVFEQLERRGCFFSCATAMDDLVGDVEMWRDGMVGIARGESTAFADPLRFPGRRVRALRDGAPQWHRRVHLRRVGTRPISGTPSQSAARLWGLL